jgi:hypothetical protein
MGLAVVLCGAVVLAACGSDAPAAGGSGGSSSIAPSLDASSATSVDGWKVPPDDEDAAVAAALTADPQAADALGRRLLADVPRRTCADAASLDLGPLAGVAAWGEVCAWGYEDASGAHQGLEIRSTTELPNLAFSAEGTHSPDVCFRRVIGDWWSFYSGNGLAEPCSASFEFQGA